MPGWLLTSRSRDAVKAPQQLLDHASAAMTLDIYAEC